MQSEALTNRNVMVDVLIEKRKFIFAVRLPGFYRTHDKEKVAMKSRDVQC